MKPKVTIGICVKNGEKWIGNAIKSIIAQDYPHELLEVIFVDDGSEDKSLLVIKECTKNVDFRVKIFSNKWRGLGYARNMVVKNSKSKYIVWVDSDTILSPDFISQQIEFMERNKQVGIATGTIWFRNEDPLFLKLELVPSIVKYYQNDTWHKCDITKLPGAAGSVYRLDAIRYVGGFDKTIRGAGEDQYMAKKIIDAGYLICRRPSLFFETHGNLSKLADVFHKYIWYGASCYHLYRRQIYKISLLKMNPIAGFIYGLLTAMKAYPIIRQKFVFLCPFYCCFRMFAWVYGFTKVKTKSW